MADVFISYKREDHGHARRLADALKSRGFSVWYDFELISGDQYRGVIRRVIDRCEAAVVIWSRKAVQSDFVLDEASHAKKSGKLCPVRVDDVEPPLGFGQIHTNDLSDWDGEATHHGFLQFLRAIESRVARPTGGLVSGSVAIDRNDRELEAFKLALAARTDAALRAYLKAYPDGLFAGLVREQRSVVNRIRRWPTSGKVAAAISSAAVLLGVVYLVAIASVIARTGILPGADVREPLSDPQLEALVRQSLELSARGECSDALMQRPLLDACRAQAANNQADLAPRGAIVEVKSKGRQRVAGFVYTDILVKFATGPQHWYARGATDGRLSALFTPNVS